MGSRFWGPELPVLGGLGLVSSLQPPFGPSAGVMGAGKLGVCREGVKVTPSP